MLDCLGILIRNAEYYLRNDLALPTDMVARLLEAGIDVASLERRCSS